MKYSSFIPSHLHFPLILSVHPHAYRTPCIDIHIYLMCAYTPLHIHCESPPRTWMAALWSVISTATIQHIHVLHVYVHSMYLVYVQYTYAPLHNQLHVQGVQQEDQDSCAPLLPCWCWRRYSTPHRGYTHTQPQQRNLPIHTHSLLWTTNHWTDVFTIQDKGRAWTNSTFDSQIAAKQEQADVWWKCARWNV